MLIVLLIVQILKLKLHNLNLKNYVINNFNNVLNQLKKLYYILNYQNHKLIKLY